MQRIKPENYPSVRPLFEALRYNLAIDSILDGNTHGRVYADNVQKPEVALVWNELEAIFLAGDPTHPAINNSFRWLLYHELEALARSKGVPGFNFHITEPWQRFLIEALPEHTLQIENRRYHRLNSKLVHPFPLPPGFQLCKIDSSLLEHSELGNIEQVLGWVYSFWGSIEGLTDHGIGYFLLHDRTIASWCLSVYTSADQVELGVATVPDFRHQGLASFVAAACVQACLQKGLSPTWHCDTNNLASVAVAAKVGFVPLFDYVVYHFDFSIEE